MHNYLYTCTELYTQAMRTYVLMYGVTTLYSILGYSVKSGTALNHAPVELKEPLGRLHSSCIVHNCHAPCMRVMTCRMSLIGCTAA